MAGLMMPTRKNSRSVGVLPYAYYTYAIDTAAALLTSAFMTDIISDIRVQTVAAGGETIEIQGSVDGTNYDTLTPQIETTGQLYTTSALPSGKWVLPIKKFGHYRIFKLVKSAAVQSGTGVIACVQPWNKPGP